MNSENKDAKPAERRAGIADHSAPTEDKPKIIQPGPIIIKGGSVDIDTTIFDFKDDDGKLGNHYICERPGRLTFVLIRDGANVHEIPLTSNNPRVTIMFEPTA